MSTHKVYWFMYDHFVQAWNNFKSFIGHPSDPTWIRWLVDHIPGYYPKKEMEELKMYWKWKNIANQRLKSLNAWKQKAKEYQSKYICLKEK